MHFPDMSAKLGYAKNILETIYIIKKKFPMWLKQWLTVRNDASDKIIQFWNVGVKLA